MATCACASNGCCCKGGSIGSIGSINCPAPTAYRVKTTVGSPGAQGAPGTKGDQGGMTLDWAKFALSGGFYPSTGVFNDQIPQLGVINQNVAPSDTTWILANGGLPNSYWLKAGLYEVKVQLTTSLLAGSSAFSDVEVKLICSSSYPTAFGTGQFVLFNEAGLDTLGTQTTLGSSVTVYVPVNVIAALFFFGKSSETNLLTGDITFVRLLSTS